MPVQHELPTLELQYFNLAGKAEGVRLALAYAGVKFKDTRFTFEEFSKLKADGVLPFGQVPCLVVGSGKTGQVLVQTAAILRYVGKISSGLTQHPLYPDDPLMAATVDAIVDQDTDMMIGYLSSQYSERFGFGDVVQRDGPPEKRRCFGLVRRRLHDDVLPRHLQALAGLLANSKTGWLAGSDGPTIADFMIVPTLQRLRGRTDGPPIGLGDGLSTGLVDRYPSLLSLIDKLMALPLVQDWYAARKQVVTYSRIPPMGFGTFNNWSGNHAQNEDQAISESVTAAIRAGYRHFDCAELYGNELAIGRALAAAQVNGEVTRSELFLVSKAWNHRRSPESLREALVTTLKALQTEYLDLYIVHWPVCWTPESCASMVTSDQGVPVITRGKDDPRGEQVVLAEAWHAMEALVDEGLVRQLGVSNCGVERLQRLVDSCRIRPICNQVECHPHLAQGRLLAYCQSKGIDLVAYHPLGKPNFRKEGEPVAIADPLVLRIAGRLGCTPAQVLLAWHMSKGVVVIPKSCTPSRIIENFEALKIKLAPDDVAAIDQMDKGWRFCSPPWMPNWD